MEAADSVGGRLNEFRWKVARGLIRLGGERKTTQTYQE